MGKIHAGATLTPHFREFLPAWVAGQPWYEGRGALRPAGFLRFEDPAGEVGVETHLLRDDEAVWQVPLTYRSAPLAGAELVTQAQHSVLGTRWIYDAVTDPVWIAAILNLVATGGVSDSAARTGFGPAQARGVLIGPMPAVATIDLDRRVVQDDPLPDAAGVVTGSWHQDGSRRAGRFAVIRASEH
ncbi:MAG TPA: hypothetical protein VF821_16785 [Lentzea sp.]